MEQRIPEARVPDDASTTFHGATLTCRCGRTVLAFAEPAPRYRLLCCCNSCWLKNAHAAFVGGDLAGGAAAGHRGAAVAAVADDTAEEAKDPTPGTAGTNMPGADAEADTAPGEASGEAKDAPTSSRGPLAAAAAASNTPTCRESLAPVFPSVPPRLPPMDLFYMGNRFEVARGGEHIRFNRLREGTTSTNCIAGCCGTVLCVDHPGYQQSLVMGFLGLGQQGGHGGHGGAELVCAADGVGGGELVPPQKRIREDDLVALAAADASEEEVLATPGLLPLEEFNLPPVELRVPSPWATDTVCVAPPGPKGTCFQELLVASRRNVVNLDLPEAITSVKMLEAHMGGGSVGFVR